MSERRPRGPVHEVPCTRCGVVRKIKHSLFIKNKPRFCNNMCRSVWLRESGVLSGSNNPAYGKTYRTKETHPEWAEAISKGSVAAGVNVGDRNAMKRPDVAAKMAATRRAVVTSDPVYRASMAAKARARWADGKHDGTATGRCRWYDHLRPDGSVVKLQGTWEVALARRLDELGVSYTTHEGRWPYQGDDGETHTYYPDFYVPAFDTYIDVKGGYWDELQRVKFDSIRRAYPDRSLVVADRAVLTSWLVNVQKVSRELLADRTT